MYRIVNNGGISEVYIEDVLDVFNAACIGEDRKPQYYFNEKIPENYHGTGDVFASAFSGALLNGFSLYDSMCIAVRFTCDCIKRTKENSPDTHYGVDFERGIPYLLKELKKI